MATRDEIVDQIAGFALFADLTTPQLERIAHMFEEEVFPEGPRVLRQGLSGSAFHIILDGEADGRRSTASSGRRWPAATSSARSRSCSASRPAPTSSPRARCGLLVLAGPAVEAFLLDNPPLMYRMLQAQARRLRNANRWRS